MTVFRKSLLILLTTLWIQSLVSSPVSAQSAIQSAPSTRTIDGGTVPKSQTPTFDWSAVTGANTYTLEICKAAFTTAGTCAAGLAIPAATLIPTTTYTPTTELPRNVVLYWRVRGVSTVYGPGPWSAVSNFLSANAPPRPVASLPAATVNGTMTPTLTWSTTVVSGTSIPNYDIQVCTLSTCATGSIAASTTTGGSTATGSTATLIKRSWQVTPALESGTQYYWRVRSKASNGNASGWSASLGLKTLVAPPTQTAPADNADLDTTTPTFTWNTVQGATSYAIEVSRTGVSGVYTALTGATALPATSTSFTPAATIGVATAPNTQLYWRVKATSTAFGISYSTARRMTPAQAPNPPTLTALTAIQTTQRPTFKWVSTKASTTQEPVNYELQLATNTTFTQGLITKVLTRAQAGCVQTGTASLYTYTCTYPIDTNLATGTSYYWRVRAESSNGDASSFTTIASTSPVKIGLLNAPGLTSPANNSTSDLATPTFTWNVVSGALSYTVQLCKVPFSATGVCTSFLVAAATSTTNSWTPATGLPVSTPTYWNVRANSTLYGASKFSNSSYFVTAGAPLPPVLTAFVGAQPVRPIFKWTSQKTTASLLPNAYELQIATDIGFTQNVTTRSISRQTSCPGTGTAALTTYTCTYNLDINLTNGTSYFWRVRSETGSAATDDSSAWVTNAVASPLKIVLERPTLVSPVGGTDVDNTNPIFTWNTVTGATTYSVKKLVGTVWTAITGTVTVSGATATFKPSVVVTTTPLGGDVSWQVVATSTLYGTATSNTGVFTSAAAPTVPVLTQFPTTSQTTLRPTFKWSSTKTTATLEPTSYELQIAKDTAFTQGLITKSLTRAQAGCVQSGTTASLKYTCAYPIDVNLSTATTYQWRVRAKAASGDASAWVANGATTPLKIGITDAPDTGDPIVTVSVSPSTTTAIVGDTVTLSTTVGGTATGTPSFEYRCKATDAYSPPTSNSSYPCPYSAAGSFIASARVTKQGVSGTGDSQTITITTDPNSVPPSGGSTKTMKVLEIRYFPYDAATKPANTAVLRTELTQALIAGSRPKAYKYPSAINSINPLVVRTIDRFKQSPNTTGQHASWYHSLNTILTGEGENLCDYIRVNAIDQVWMWFDVRVDDSDTQYDTGGFNSEFVQIFSSDMMPNQSPTPICNGDRTFIAYGLDQNRTYDLALHSFGHSFENLISQVQGYDLFQTRWGGSNVNGYHRGTCGNVHFPPNGTIDYNYTNPTTVSTRCENWEPDGTGTATTISCSRWGCEQGGFLKWWLQNTPSYNNGLRYQDRKIPNWFEFFSGTDAVVKYYGTRNDEWWMDPTFMEGISPSYNSLSYVDNKTTAQRNDGNTLSWTHASSGTDRLLVVTVAYGSDDGTPLPAGYISDGNVKCGSTSLTRARADYHNKNTEIWYMKAQPNSCALNITYSGTVYDSIASAISFTGVNQTSPVTASTGTGNPASAGGSGNWALTLPTTTDDLVLGAYASYTDSNTVTPTNKTQQAFYGRNSGTVLFVGTKKASSASTTINWSNTYNWFWSATGITINLL